MRKKEKDPYFVGTANMSIEIDRRSDKSKSNISWNDGEIRPSLTTPDLNTQTNEIKVNHSEPLWV